jgi:hypothetical protein
MKIIGKKSVASILHNILWIVFVFLIICSVLLSGIFVVLMINPKIETFNSYRHLTFLYELPSEVMQQDFEVHSSVAAIYDAKINLVGSINFRMASRMLVFLYFCTVFMILGVGLIIIHQLKQFLKTTIAGNPFEQANIKRIRIIGWTVIISQAIKLILGLGFWFYLKSPVQINGSSVSLYWHSFEGIFDDTFGVTFLGLVILVIAEIFREGFKLREEQELTI